MGKDYNRTFSKEDDPDDAVWSKIEKRQAQRAAAKERRRTGKLNKGQRKEKRHEAVRATGRYSEKYATFKEKMDAKDLRRANRKEKTEESGTEEVLTQMKQHFSRKHGNGTVEEMRDEEGNVTGLHWAKDEEEPEPLVSIEGEEVTVAVTASTEEEAVAKLGERLRQLTGDPALEFDFTVNRHATEPEENLEPRRKSRVVERGYERNHKLVALAKGRAGYRCEVKGCTVELFVKPDGHRYVEVHHLITMAEGGPDTMENLVCVCANHHRELHYGENRNHLREQLQRLRAGEKP